MKRMLINAIDAEESRIAVVEDGVLQELHVEIANREAYLGNIYKGRVVNIEPSIGAAFVNFGGRSNGFLHVSDVLPAYGEEEVSLEDIIEGRARVMGDGAPESVRSVLDDDGESEEEVDFHDDDEDDVDDADDAEEDAAEADSEDSADDEPEDDEPEDDASEPPVEAATAPAGRGVDGEDADVDAGEPVVVVPDVEAGATAEDDADAAPAEGKKKARKKTKAKKKTRRRSRAKDGDAPDADPSGGDAGSGEEDAPSSRSASSDTPEPPAADSEPSSDGGPDEGPDGGPVFFMASRGRRGKAAGSGEKGEVVAVEARKSGRGRGRNRRSSSRDRTPKQPIDQLLKKGQEVVVQVTKEGIGAKGPTLTTYVSLPGRCLVLMPTLPKCGVSRKIASDKERRRLKRIVRELDETGQGGLGFIVRTAGVDKTRDELERDRDYLKKIWELVAQRLKVTRAPALLYQESDLVLKAMRDLFTPSIEDVAVDSKDVFLRIKDFTEKLMPRMAERIKRHESTTPLFHAFGIEAEVQTLYQPRVELPSGISIVIDQTEALVAIDVNSGKFKPGTKFDETAYRTNMEAIPEITRQLRLRDLGGVIIIDFIDMTLDKHKRGVERKLIECMRGDKARIKIGKISPFGMMELTRQRVGPGLKRTVFNTCSHCDGAGLTRTVQSKALAVLRDVRAILHLKGYSVLQVFVAPSVNDYLVNFKRRTLLDLEEEIGKSVIVKGEPSYPVDVVHYRFLTADGQEARVAIPAGLGVKV